MDPGPLLDRALDDEGLTAGLEESETMRLIAVVSDRIRAVAAAAKAAAAARSQTEQICRRAREIARQVSAAAPGTPRVELMQRLLNEWSR